MGSFAIITVFLTPLAFGLIKKNYFYGFRLKNSMRSDKLWLEINKKCAIFSINLLIIPVVIIGLIKLSGNEISNVFFTILIILYVAIMAIKTYFIDKSYSLQQEN